MCTISELSNSISELSNLIRAPTNSIRELFISIIYWRALKLIEEISN